MKMAPMLFAVFLLMAACGHRSESPEQAFWTWFQKNEASLFNFENDRERIFDRLANELHRVDPALTFAFGPKEGGRREFVISADGIRAAFPKVESLYAAAPSLPRWKFIKFRPRRAPGDVNYAGISVKARAVAVGLERAGPKVNLTVYMPGYSKTGGQAYSAIAFLLLDQALGEYDVETRVGSVDIKPSDEATPKAYSLEALPKAFDSSFATQQVQL